MNCPGCKTNIEEEDFDLMVGTRVLTFYLVCSECGWMGRAVVSIENFIDCESDPETAA